MEKACKVCKRLTEASECDACKSTDLTRNWKGTIVVYDVEADMAKKSANAIPGKYCLQVY